MCYNEAVVLKSDDGGLGRITIEMPAKSQNDPTILNLNPNALSFLKFSGTDAILKNWVSKYCCSKI